MALTNYLNKLQSIENLYGSTLPPYFTSLKHYLDALSSSDNMVHLPDGLHASAGSLKKRFLKDFSITVKDYTDGSLLDRSGNHPLRLLLDTLFDMEVLYNPEVLKRYLELLNVISKFTPAFADVHILNGDASLNIVNDYTGEMYTYRKRPDFIKYVVEANDIYVLYPDTDPLPLYLDGSPNPELIADDRRQSILKRSGTYTDKDHLRSLINGVFFQNHTLTYALRHGVDNVKHTMGRFSPLTLDHMDGVGVNNHSRNVRLVTRRDNVLLKSNPNLPIFDFTNL